MKRLQDLKTTLSQTHTAIRNMHLSEGLDTHAQDNLHTANIPQVIISSQSIITSKASVRSKNAK